MLWTGTPFAQNMATCICEDDDRNRTTTHRQKLIHQVKVIFHHEDFSRDFRIGQRIQHYRNVANDISAPISSQNQAAQIIAVA
ncbi:Uncharacterised protein [Mycobacterium tuberculosis]|nr:Uncharacterised protein [Mycobacterium tuberculosis]